MMFTRANVVSVLGPETLYVRVREAVDGMLTLRASKVVVFVRKRSLMCKASHWCRG